MFAELHCQLYPGQFSSEFAVVVTSFSGREFSLFASRDEVRSAREPGDDEPVDGWLRVKVLEGDGEHVLVQLPQSTIENGPYLAVRRDKLRLIPEIAAV
jgi:hypothetical protein